MEQIIEYLTLFIKNNQLPPWEVESDNLIFKNVKFRVLISENGTSGDIVCDNEELEDIGDSKGREICQENHICNCCWSLPMKNKYKINGEKLELILNKINKYVTD